MVQKIVFEDLGFFSQKLGAFSRKEGVLHRPRLSKWTLTVDPFKSFCPFCIFLGLLNPSTFGSFDLLSTQNPTLPDFFLNGAYLHHILSSLRWPTSFGAQPYVKRSLRIREGILKND